MSTFGSPPRKPLAAVHATASEPWAIVLAGGEGVRLRPLVRLVHGDDRPKQFASLLGGQSLLRHTLDRVQRGISSQRTVVVTQQRHEHYVATELGAASFPHVLAQPADRGTAAGILLPAHWVSWRDPSAVVVVFPSDHFVSDHEAFMRHALGAAALARQRPERLILVAATATSPETQYGWVEPGLRIGWIDTDPVFEVARFCEKPDAEAAQRCWTSGGLWNTLVLAGTVRTLLDVGWRALPALSARLAGIAAFAGTAEEPSAIHDAYALAPVANFSRDVLERRPADLAVSRLPARVTWSDWGTPDRVLETLRLAGLETPWVTRPPVAASAGGP